MRKHRSLFARMAEALLSTETYVRQVVRPILSSRHSLVATRVNLEVTPFLSCLRSVGLRCVESSDGIISTVQESNDPADFSRQSGFFDLHKDGLYLRNLPDYVLLYCEDPGFGETPTIFIDTRPIAEHVISEAKFEALTHLEMVYFGKENDIYARPLIGRHPKSGEPVINLGARAFVRPGSSIKGPALPCARLLGL